MNGCLRCYQPLGEHEQDFHSTCSRKLFGQSTPPALPYSEEDLKALALEVIRSRTTLTGVQAKISLQLSGTEQGSSQKRFTIVGLWGGYILKPPTSLYPQLPEVEHLTMHLAASTKIKTAPHSLIRLASGNLAYITPRIDRRPKKKLAMEDFCQLTERLTEDKYRGSYEQIAKKILQFSANPVLDVIDFFELVLFSFLTGNADMHLKNFSLLEQPGLGMTLAPAYDLVNTALVNPSDQEDLALTLNGKKRKINRSDFTQAMETLGLQERQQENIFRKITRAIPGWMDRIDRSFLTEENKRLYKDIVHERASRIM